MPSSAQGQQKFMCVYIKGSTEMYEVIKASYQAKHSAVPPALTGKWLDKKQHVTNLLRLLNELLRNAKELQRRTEALAEQQDLEGFPTPREFQRHSDPSAAFWEVAVNQPAIDYPNLWSCIGPSSNLRFWEYRYQGIHLVYTLKLSCFASPHSRIWPSFAVSWFTTLVVSYPSC